jgi:HEAT repeat protein/cellulose biosynthesis protein BcsQ
MTELDSPNRLPGLVCTFYSYKGGVGRSMALANVGVLMAGEGHRILLVDWDLEAPGLEIFFRNAAKLAGDPATTPGVVDLLEAQAQGTQLAWRDCLLKAEFFGHSVDILTAGRRTDDYRHRVQQLDWDRLFRDHGIGNYINSLREEWRAEYDFVLIDSRTGITDIGDICTVILPDVLVFFFVTNHQNVEGIKSVMARAVKARSKLPVNRSKLLGVPVPSRDERDREYDKSIEWQRIFAKEFSELYREWLPKEVDPSDALNRIFIPYVASWSFGERIPVIESERERADPTSLGAAYARLATLLSHRLDWSAIEAKSTAADLVGARVELSKAREEVREAEVRLTEEARRREEEIRLEEARRLEAESRLEQAQQATASSKKRMRIFAVTSSLLLLLTIGFASWWYVTNPTPPTPAQLVARLNNPDPTVRAEATNALGNLAIDDHRVDQFAPEVARLLKDSDAGVRSIAARNLIRMGNAGAKFAPQVADLLKDDDTMSRAWAAYSLSNMGEAGLPFAPGIVTLLKAPNAYEREWAAKALGKMGKPVAKFAPDVAALLNDQNPMVQKAAANALKQMGAEQLLKK